MCDEQLLNEVLGFEFGHIELIKEKGNNIVYALWSNPKKQLLINKYEFAFKCKEWAFNKGYHLISCKDNCYCCKVGEKDVFNIYEDGELGSEIEYIFKVCRYINSLMMD